MNQKLAQWMALMITFRSFKDKYLGPNEPEAGPVDGFDDNVQKVKKQLIEPEMLGRS